MFGGDTIIIITRIIGWYSWNVGIVSVTARPEGVIAGNKLGQ